MSEITRLTLDYLPVVIFLVFATGMGLLFILGSVLLAPSNPDPEKNSAYECGFNAFDECAYEVRRAVLFSWRSCSSFLTLKLHFYFRLP